MSASCRRIFACRARIAGRATLPADTTRRGRDSQKWQKQRACWLSTREIISGLLAFEANNRAGCHLSSSLPLSSSSPHRSYAVSQNLNVARCVIAISTRCYASPSSIFCQLALDSIAYRAHHHPLFPWHGENAAPARETQQRRSSANRRRKMK